MDMAKEGTQGRVFDARTALALNHRCVVHEASAPERTDELAGELRLSGNGTVLFADDRATRLLGLRRTHASLYPRIEPADVQAFTAHITEAVERGRARSGFIRLRAPKAAVVRLLTRRVTGGTSECRLESVVIDASEWHAHEQAVTKTPRMFRELLSRLPDGVAVLREGEIEYANATLYTLLGVKEPRLGPGPLVKHVVEAEQRAMAQWLAAAADRGLTRDWQFVGRDGVVRTAECTAGPMRMIGRGGVVFSARDVTDRRRIRTEREQTHRMASIGLLAAGVAHEINNPLAYVYLSLNEARESSDKRAHVLAEAQQALSAIASSDDPARTVRRAQSLLHRARQLEDTRPLQAAMDGAQQVRRIVRELGTFCRTDERPSPIVLDRLIRRAVDMAAPQIRPRARLEVGPTGNANILGIEGQLCQVLLNVLVNAAHACTGRPEDQRVTLRVRLDGEWAAIEIADTGCGISADRLQKIFDPFFTTKAPGKGTGLGLSLCRNYIEAHGGTITISSDEGVGTQVLIRLPTVSVTSQATEASANTAPPELARTQAQRDPSEEEPPSRPRILYVDDEDLLRNALARRLSRRFEVVTASSGDEALALLDNDNRFDLIVSDLLMDHGTGMDLFRGLEDGGQRRLSERTVFITGGAHTPESAQFLGRCGRPVAHKPMTTTELVRFITECIAAVPHEDGAPASDEPVVGFIEGRLPTADLNIRRPDAASRLGGSHSHPPPMGPPATASSSR
ncbi:MAG: response regulator [Deltaproteobacteria bacterium]|nr:response regulator [Deltaproteobacteria bacterium]